MDLLRRGIVENPPFVLRDGGIIADGYNAELDELRCISREGKGFIARLEAQERARTGINSLKIRYNKVFGYYIEVTKSNLAGIPERLLPPPDAGQCRAVRNAGTERVRREGLGAEERIVEPGIRICSRRSGKPVAAHGARIAAQPTVWHAVDVLVSLAGAGTRPRLLPPGDGQRRSHFHHRRKAPGHRGDGPGGALCPQRYLSSIIAKTSC